MRICAVILNYYGAEDTIACALQLESQKVEHICVVDNSADKDQIALLAEAFTGRQRIGLLKTDTNLGFAAGVNFALRRLPLTDFDTMLILNNDTVIPEDFLENLSEAARKDALQIAGPRIHHYPNTEKLWSRGSWYNAWCGCVTRRPLPLPGNIFYLTGCCMLIDRLVFEKIGLLNEEFFMYGEDVDFCVRAARAGIKTGIVDSSLLFHKTNASSRDNSLFYEQQVARSHLLLSRTLFKNSAARTLATSIKTAFLFTRAFFRTLRFGNLNAIRGLIRALTQKDSCSDTGR